MGTLLLDLIHGRVQVWVVGNGVEPASVPAEWRYLRLRLRLRLPFSSSSCGACCSVDTDTTPATTRACTCAYARGSLRVRDSHGDVRFLTQTPKSRQTFFSYSALHCTAKQREEKRRRERATTRGDPTERKLVNEQEEEEEEEEIANKEEECLASM